MLLQSVDEQNALIKKYHLLTADEEKETIYKVFIRIVSSVKPTTFDLVVIFIDRFVRYGVYSNLFTLQEEMIIEPAQSLKMRVEDLLNELKRRFFAHLRIFSASPQVISLDEVEQKLLSLKALAEHSLMTVASANEQDGKKLVYSFEHHQSKEKLSYGINLKHLHNQSELLVTISKNEHPVENHVFPLKLRLNIRPIFEALMHQFVTKIQMLALSNLKVGKAISDTAFLILDGGLNREHSMLPSYYRFYYHGHLYYQPKDVKSLLVRQRMVISFNQHLK